MPITQTQINTLKTQATNATNALVTLRSNINTLVADTATPPPPPPPPDPDLTPVPTGGKASAFIGPFNTSAETIAQAGVFKTYEDRFASWAEKHWTSYGPKWEGNGGAGYDMAKIYYIWHERTGKPEYLTRANALAVDYRDRYTCGGTKTTTNPDGWNKASEPWHQYLGLALHAKYTGDAKTIRVIGNNADYACYDIQDLRYTSKISNSWNVNRLQVAYGNALLAAVYTNAPSDGAPPPAGIPGGHNWRTALDQVVTDIINTQNSAGYWRFTGASGDVWMYPYQAGLAMNFLIDYWYLVNKDVRILACLKKSCDWLWNSARDPVKGTFRYVMEDNTSGGEPYSAIGAGAELTMMSANAFGFVYNQTKDAVYKTRGDAIITVGMAGDGSNPPGAYLDGYKQFQETYAFSYRYPYYRST